MLNINKFKAKVIENGLRMQDVAKGVGINSSTMYRKLSANGSTFTVHEVKEIGKLLNLTSEELMVIFFNEDVA